MNDMKELLDRRYILKKNWVTVLGALLCLYFSYHLIQGDRSYSRLVGLQQAIARDSAAYDELVVEREKLEHRVQMLRPGSINPDYLEERARYMLGYRSDTERDLLISR